MKLRYLILLTILVTVGYYVYQDPGLNKKLMNKVNAVAPELNNSTLYKWKNKKGEWQVTDKPPAEGIPFTTVSTNDQVNVMPTQRPDRKK